MKQFTLSVACLLVMIQLRAQSLMPQIADDNLSELLDKPAVIQRTDGSKISGILANCYLYKGNLSNIALKLSDGTKQKYKQEEIESIKIRMSKPIRFSIVDSSGKPVRDIINAYIIFDHPLRGETKGAKSNLAQLLNPGFDSRIKIYADPSGTEFKSISIRGNDLGNRDLNAFIFVKDGETTYVRQSTYEAQFTKFFGDCDQAINEFGLQDRVFEELTNHVIFYDSNCKQQ